MSERPGMIFLTPYHKFRVPNSMDFIVYLNWTSTSNRDCSFTLFGWLEIPYHSIEFWMFGELGSSERLPPELSTYR